MSLQVTLAGDLFDWNTDFVGTDGFGYSKPYQGNSANAPVLMKILQDFLQEVINQKAGIASVSGVAPGAAGNALVSNGSTWTRSSGSGVTVLFDALTVSGTSSLQAVTATTGTFSGIVLANGATSSGAAVEAQLAANYTIVARADASHRMALGHDGTHGKVGTLDAQPFDFLVANTVVGTFASSGLTVNNGLTVSAGGITVQAGASSFQGLSAASLSAGSGTNHPAPLSRVTSTSGFAYFAIGNGDVANTHVAIGGASSIMTFGTMNDAGTFTEGMRLTGSVLSLNSGGALQLGVAYTAGAPSATGYVTLKDSTGTTYKVLVST